MIRFGSIISFSAVIFCYFALFTGSTSCSVLFMASISLVSLGSTCFSAALLSFLSDQLIYYRATSDELSAAVQWCNGQIAVGSVYRPSLVFRL